MKNTNRQPSSGSVLLGMAAGAALGAVGTMAMAQNQRQVKRTARKLAKGAERAMSQLDTMVTPGCTSRWWSLPPATRAARSFTSGWASTMASASVQHSAKKVR